MASCHYVFMGLATDSRFPCAQFSTWVSDSTADHFLYLLHPTPSDLLTTRVRKLPPQPHADCRFHGACKGNMVFTFLHGFKIIIIRRRTFPDMWKAYAIPMSMFINKVLLEQKQGHFVYLPSGCFHTRRTKVLSPCDRHCVAHRA